MNLALRFYDRTIVALGHVPGFIIACVAVLLTVDVLSRNLGFGGIHYTVDIVQYCILISTMCGGAWVLRLGRHVRMDLVTMSLPRKIRHRVEIGAYAFTVLVSGVLAYFGIWATVKSFRSGNMLYNSFDLPEWMPLAVVAFGFSLFTMETLRTVIVLVRRGDLSDTEAGEVF